MEMTQMFRTRIKTCPSEINLRESQSESSSMLDWDANLNRRNTFAADKSSSYEWDQSRSSFRSRIRKFFGDNSSNKEASEEDVFRHISPDESLNGSDTSDSRRKGNDSTTPFKDGIPNFLQKKIQPSVRRSKSTKIGTGKENHPIMDLTSLMAQGGQINRTEVDLPFFMPPIESPDVIDLSSNPSDFYDASVRPLHYSILGRNYCFEVLSKNGTRCFGCDSAGERENWIEKIKRAINPNLDNSRRTEHHLILFVQEAKGVQSKKKYFCEVCLDRQLFARTTSKWKNDTVLWCEQFEFTSMPSIDDITVHLYKDSDKKKKKDKDYIGLVNLPVRSLVNQQSVEKWYPLSTPSGNNKSKAGESMAIRIKARFLSTPVLPTEEYKNFAEHISRNYLSICSALQTCLSASRKDEIGRILVNIMYGTGSIKEYMTEIVMVEVAKVEEESLIFRENTIGTKSVEAFLRLVGMKYLHNILGDFIQALFTMREECEVDGSRLPPNASLDVNQSHLRMSCEIALCKITNSTNIFPSELREVMASWKALCEDADRPRIANRLVTASLFLRLLCPAILNPSLFGLANEVPDPKTSRTLTLIAKVIQNLANRSRFGNKEEYMQFMDVFVREKWDDMGEFINNVSDNSVCANNAGFQGFIDLGKEFAKLHAFFVEVLPTLDAATVEKLGELPDILKEISKSLENYVEEVASSSLERPSAPLTRIIEDSAFPKVHSNVLFPGNSSTPVVERKSFNEVGVASSLMDLREFNRKAEEGMYDNQPGGTTSGYSPPNLGNQSSIPVSSSFNNSNNYRQTPPNRAIPHSTEKLGANTKQPLMFNNPAYKSNQKNYQRGISSPASLTSLHDSLMQLARTYVPPEGDPEQGVALSSSNNFLSSPTTPSQQPLSLTNPLQKLNSHHLETVFSTETVTYAAPSQKPHTAVATEVSLRNNRSQPVSLLSLEIPTNLRRQDSEKSLVESPSLDSSLSSHQSSTTTNSLSQISENNKDPKPHTPHPSKVVQGFTVFEDSTKQNQNLSKVEFIEPRFKNSPELPRPSSNANLKSEFPSGNQNTDGVVKPQPKPRTSVGGLEKLRKSSVPNRISTQTNILATRRSSESFKLKTNYDNPSYPSLILSNHDQDVIMELNTAKPEVETRREKHNDNLKDQDGFVTAPATAVKSRVVVATSNATRIKTSKHSTNFHQPAQSQHSQHWNNANYNKQPQISSTKIPQTLEATPSYPPTTPEDPLSPEARTARWILNNVSIPNKGMKNHDEPITVLTPKDYEERIIRLETEVERLRSRLGESMTSQRSSSNKEAIFMDKIRVLEKRESRALEKFQNEQKFRHQAEVKINETLKHLNNVESEQNRERLEIQSILESKECVVAEQQKKIGKLERANARLLQTLNRLNPSTALSSNPEQLSPYKTSNSTKYDDVGFIDSDLLQKRHHVNNCNNHGGNMTSSKPNLQYYNGSFPCLSSSDSTSSSL